MLEIRGQSGIELATLTAFLIMLLTVFVVVAQQRQNDVVRERNYSEAQRIASLVAAHINTAASVGGGYSSSFILPPGIHGYQYNVSAVAAEQRILVEYGERNFSATAQILTSDIQANFLIGGVNGITNEAGVVRIG